MPSDEPTEILINSSTISNEQAIAEKLAITLSVVLPKMIRREIEKDLKNKMINTNFNKE